MSWGRVAAVAGAIVWTGLMLAVGKVWGNAEGEEDRKKMNLENEELRGQIRSILETFKTEMAKKNEEIAWLEAVIDHLMESPPSNAARLRQRLRLFNLTETQFKLVVARLAPVYGE